MESMLESLIVFVQHLDSLLGVFDIGYQGGDFCVGLIFGSAGANLLFSIANIVPNATTAIPTKKAKSKNEHY